MPTKAPALQQCTGALRQWNQKRKISKNYKNYKEKGILSILFFCHHCIATSQLPFINRINLPTPEPPFLCVSSGINCPNDQMAVSIFNSVKLHFFPRVEPFILDIKTSKLVKTSVLKTECEKNYK